MKLEKQYLNSRTAGVYVAWQATESGVCQIHALSRITWPASLVIDVKVSMTGDNPQYPSGFTSLQFTANGICSPFYVLEGQWIMCPVNTIGATDTDIELTPNIE